ncbi:phosphate/phosphite/phosphonate ABC transporter substrate-binding protein [Dyella sp.]|uniref:phosphate/phosphite/phosphonate ABC transporter substrate-binding protein n=1 Tax=Dyella sp. TaxID=1869338 RepID=UPI002ECFB4A9
MPQRRNLRDGCRLAALSVAWCVLLWMLIGQSAWAGEPEAPAKPLTFGVLPMGGPSESLESWRPMLDDMGHALQRPIRSVSVSTYEGLAQALAEQRIDYAFVSGRLALQAVTQDHMQVIAQLTRGDGTLGYYSVLIVEKNSTIHTLDDIFDKPGHWRYARGESLSVSGYLVPETQLFAARKLDSDTFFASVMVDNHQNNALAVVNGEVDLATNNTADMERFAKHFPDQYARLRTVWKSSLIPHAVIIVRTDLAPQLRQRIAQFLTGYAKGRNAAAELAKLQLIHDISGFHAAGNDVLTSFADIDYTLEQRRALSAQWVNNDAMKARLQKIEAAHEQLIRQLKNNQPITLARHNDEP